MSTSAEPKSTIARLGGWLVSFSKLERIIAAFCMAIPYFLILADCSERDGFWVLIGKSLLVAAMPLAMTWIVIKSAKKKKPWLTFMGVVGLIAILYVVYLIVMPQCEPRSSISAFVAMHNAHVFGALLSIAATLFIYNGIIYFWGSPSTPDARKTLMAKRSISKWYNAVIGILLFGVVFFPCTNPDLKTLHFICAGAFFGLNAIVIGFVNEQKHRLIGILLMITSVSALGLYFYNGSVTLFWAESVALWVIGVHYILESLDLMS
ncbi:MAG: hypothetical protein AABY93_08345 [Bacteroidota bacterium]